MVSGITEASWKPLVTQMLEELRRGNPRQELYWAQQLAFGPVLVHALAIRCHNDGIDDGDTAAVVGCLKLARSGLEALPEVDGQDPHLIKRLAIRQAHAISWRRRHTLDRLLRRFGEHESEHIMPARMLRAHPLIGFKPEQRLAH